MHKFTVIYVIDLASKDSEPPSESELPGVDAGSHRRLGMFTISESILIGDGYSWVRDVEYVLIQKSDEYKDLKLYGLSVRAHCRPMAPSNALSPRELKKLVWATLSKGCSLARKTPKLPDKQQLTEPVGQTRQPCYKALQPTSRAQDAIYSQVNPIEKLALSSWLTSRR